MFRFGLHRTELGSGRGLERYWRWYVRVYVIAWENSGLLMRALSVSVLPLVPS
jgi:hypothetical protein